MKNKRNYARQEEYINIPGTTGAWKYLMDSSSGEMNRNNLAMEQQKNPKETSSFVGIKNWEIALDILQKVLEKKPKDNALLLEKANLLFRMGLYRDSLSLCQEIERDGKERWEFSLLNAACENWLHRREQMLWSTNNIYTPVPVEELHRDMPTLLAMFLSFDEALYYLSHILVNTKDPQPWYLKGAIERAQGKLKEALTSLDRALMLKKDFLPAIELKEKIRVEILRGATKGKKVSSLQDPVVVQEAKAGFSAEDWMVRGFSNIREKQYTEALKSFGEALKCDSTLYVCWYFVGKVQQELGGGDKAAQCFRKFIEGYPRSSGFYREQLQSLPPDCSRESTEDLYHRWIGHLPSDHRSWMEYLVFLLDENDYEGAWLVASEILDCRMKEWFISSSPKEFSTIKGLLELYLERTRSAKDSFGDVLKSRSNDSVALLGLGKCNENLGKFNEAEVFFKKVSESKESMLMGLYHLASLYLRRKDRSRALATIEEALRHNSDSLLLKSKKAEIILESGDYSGFMEYSRSFDNKGTPFTPLVMHNCLAYFRTQRYPEAIDSLISLRNEDPENYYFIKNLCILYLRSGKVEKALKTAEEVKKYRKCDAEYFLMQGILCYYEKRYDQSLTFLESYMNLRPLDPRLWSFLALTEYSLEHYDISGECFKKARELCGGVHHSSLNLAVFYCERGEYEKAFEFLSKIQAPQRGIQFYLCRAKCLRGIKRIEEAYRDVEEVQKVEPQNITAMTLRALLEFDRSSFTKSLEAFDRILEISDTIPEVIYSRGIVAFYINDIPVAQEAFDKAVSLNPDFFEAWLGKVVVAYSINDKEGAAKAIKRAQKLKSDEFNEWLRFASTQNDHRSTVKIYDKVPIPFYIPLVFSPEVEDPLTAFHFQGLDRAFAS